MESVQVFVKSRMDSSWAYRVATKSNNTILQDKLIEKWMLEFYEQQARMKPEE